MPKITDKLRTPEVLMDIGKQAAAGMGWAALCRYVLEKYEIKTTIPTMKLVYQTYQERRGEIVAANKEINKKILNEVEETVINTKETLKRVHVFVNELMEKSKGEDNRLALDCAREILNQLYYQEKVLNRMQSGINIENISKLEITQIVVTKLEDLQKAGRIKIIDTTLIPEADESIPEENGGNENERFENKTKDGHQQKG
jgi:hypothetical protein